jgi:DhnA family fructose-bisphosphate aldolase class Ia
MKGGAAGVSIGRNVFQHERPASMVRAIASIIFDGLSAEEAMDVLEDSGNPE